MLTRPLLLGCALLSAVAGGACATEDLHPDIAPRSSDPYGDVGVGIYLIRDDAWTQGLAPVGRYVPPYRVKLDGLFTSWDGYTYVTAIAGAEVGVPVPPGAHTIALVDDDGRVAATAPSIDARLDIPTSLAFFGDARGLRTQVFADDPAVVPAGTLHVRVLNALADHQPVQVVQCPGDDAAASTAAVCTPVGAPIAYGDLFEQDVPDDVVPQLGAHWAPPDAVDPVVWRFAGALSGRVVPSAHYTFIPTQVLGPANPCPSCLFTRF